MAASAPQLRPPSLRIRADGLVTGLAIGAGLVGLLSFLGIFASGEDASGRAVVAIVAVVLIAFAIRVTRVGLTLDPMSTTVRDVLGTYRVQRADVLGLGVERIVRGRLQRLIVVRTDGHTIPASWTIARTSNGAWLARAAYLASGFGPTQLEVAPKLAERDRLSSGEIAIPVATRDPGLTPQSVSAAEEGPQRRWLGWETAFVVAAFALPGIAAAVSILAQHVGGVNDLNEFDLPLPHHPGVSLLLLSFGYLTTALVVPIALLLLARTGQPPAALGLTRAGFGLDLTGALGLLVGSWLLTGAVALLLSVVSTNLQNTEANSHVPAYYLIYGVLISITTAINEEVVVNGYFLTRLSQLGWTRWSAFALSFAVRESYHVYYGLAFLATMPLGYLVTRSFQKRGRLGRAIMTHFGFDVVSFSIAVLRS